MSRIRSIYIGSIPLNLLGEDAESFLSPSIAAIISSIYKGQLEVTHEANEEKILLWLFILVIRNLQKSE